MVKAGIHFILKYNVPVLRAFNPLESSDVLHSVPCNWRCWISS